MVTNKNVERVCLLITMITVIVTVIFMNGSKIGIAADDSVSFSYENDLFDDSYVHSIDIEIDDWDAFIENATSEEYSAVNVTIDGETVKNVGLRAKGNTSLSTVAQLGSERYSLKLEFDAYESSTNYHGLDKLCLNNLIQDYTMMKDYITYKLMNEFGVASPLVSYVYVTVNGEDWGLYLAVEAVEDSFLERNYGTSYGDLYKPDTMSMGGGKGNGGGFDMKDVDFDKLGMDNPFEQAGDSGKGDPNAESAENDSSDKEEAFSEGSAKDESFSDENAKDESFSGENAPSEGFTPPDDMPGSGFGGFGMGSDDAKIKYIDDDKDSYSTIFNSAKTTVTGSDKKRLINSIKTLSEGIETGDADTIAEAVDVDALMRYMVVHNFVVNGDSYTGSMIHNYYLYEEDGLMTFIPWDYNLAFGTFQGGDADGAVNDPIDNPLSITDGDTDRPMFSWIISNDEYTQMYHEYYQEFLDQFYTNGYLEDLINTTYEIIYSYVEKDPTKFCELSEFETAVDTISEFVELRCQSISGQLDGSIGSTDAAQSENPDALIDASGLTLSDMGSMGGGGGFPGGDSEGGGFPGGDFPGGDFPSGGPGGDFSPSDSEDGDISEGSFPSGGPGGDFTPSDGEGGDFSEGSFPSGDSNEDFNPGNFSGFGNSNMTNYIYLGACVLALLAAIAFVYKFRGKM